MGETSETRETCEKGGTGKTGKEVLSSELEAEGRGFEVRSSRFSELRVTPVAHVMPVALTLHERRFTRKNNGSAIAAEAFVNEEG